MRGLYEYYINNISILYYIYIEFKKEEQKDRERFERRNCIGGKKLCREINFLSISIYTLIHGFGMMNGVLPIMSSLHNVATSI